MKLQILVPQYNETEDIIKNLLDSIEIQQNIDKNEIGVIIVNDGSDTHLSTEFLDKYTYQINYYLNEHKGVSAARNSCLSNSEADYVMFCDADDMFYHVYALRTIFEKIEKSFDVLISPFIEELKEKDKVGRHYIIKEDDTTFVHGKVYRRQYLIENNIFWNEDLTIHEDVYFNTLGKNFARSIERCENPFYLWKWRDDSICRKDENWVMDTYEYSIISESLLIDQLIERGKLNSARQKVASVIFRTYILMNTHKWKNNEDEDHKESVKDQIKQFYFKFEDLFSSISKLDKHEINKEEKSKFRKSIVGMTFNDWLESIKTS